MKIPGKLVLFTSGAALLMFSTCAFDLEIPLENDVPECIGRTEIKKILIYPERSVCTLQIDDQNDRSHVFYVNFSDTMSGRDTHNLQAWPGNVDLLTGGYESKSYHVQFDTARLGLYSGDLILKDADSAVLTVPLEILNVLSDPFDDFPLSTSNWAGYAANDSMHIHFNYIDRKLEYMFQAESLKSGVRNSTGIRSRYALASDLVASVNLKLRDEMDDAFEVAFFISTSPDTSRWSGQKAGVFISGIDKRLRIECRSVDLQSFSFESTLAAGELGIARVDSTVNFYFHDGNPLVQPQSLTSQNFPAEVPVFIHLKMIVKNHDKIRSCQWSDFMVTKGVVSFSAVE